jgi:hypothetical protein
VSVRSPSRFGSASLTALLLAVATLCAGSVGAGAAGATTPTTACPTPQVLAGMSAIRATVTTPGATPRTLNESQITAFLQTWLAYSVYENPPQEHPPTNLPVASLNVTVIENGQAQPLPLFYASDGRDAWVGAPAPVPAPPPNDQKWIRVPKPAETIAAFAGNRSPVCEVPATAASTAPTTPTTLKLAVTPTGTSSGSGAPWIVIIVGVLVVAAAAVAATRLRRKRSA